VRIDGLLISNFETVGSAPGRFILEGDPIRNGEPGINLLRIPYGELVYGLKTLDESALPQVSSSYLRLHLGAHNWTQPQGFGLASGQYCFIATGGPSDDEKIRILFRHAAETTFDGRSLWWWTAPGGEGHPDRYTFFAILLSGTDSELIIANTRSDLERVEQLLVNTAKPSPIFNSFSDPKVHNDGYWLFKSSSSLPIIGSTMNKTNAKSLALELELQSPDGEALFRINCGKAVGKLNCFNLAELNFLSSFRMDDTSASIPSPSHTSARDVWLQLLSLFGYSLYV
jgi:hypothetical protein